MAKLNQIIALTKSIKSRTHARLTKAHHKLKKVDLLIGRTRTYQPRDDEGEKYPPESQIVQCRVPLVLEEISAALIKMFDAVATQDATNCMAAADVKVDGALLLSAVPVTTLLFLEKQLTDLNTFISKIPILDPTHEWEWDNTSDCFVTEPTKTVKTKKVPRNHIKYEATKEHPAQVETYSEDVVVGEWTTIHLSGAIPETKHREMLEKVHKLQDAIKAAREEANGREIVNAKIGESIFQYLFAD